MKEEKGSIVVNFIVRMIVGLALIFFLNKYLEFRDIPVAVGMNGISVLTAGTLGIPGVALLYGVLFYCFL